MPQVMEHVVSTYEETDSEPCVLRSLFDEARSEFKRRVSAKRAIFERYLDTRVNWLRLQLMREAEATDSLTMNHLEFLRTYKPDWVPEATLVLFVFWYLESHYSDAFIKSRNIDWWMVGEKGRGRGSHHDYLRRALCE